MSLPTTEPLAHRNVATSQDAAHSLSRAILREQHRRMLHAYRNVHPDGLTSEEMEVHTGMRTPTITPRRLELEQAGLISNDGERRSNRSGRTAYVWKITDAGLTVLQEV